MNIGIIESKLDGKGGSQRQALSLACALQTMGHEVAIYTLALDREKCFPDLLDKLRVVSLPQGREKIKSLPMLGALNYIRYSIAESRAAKKLALMIDKNTDVINAHDRLGFRVATYAKKYVCPFPSVLMMSDILTKQWIAWRRGQFKKEYVPSWKQKIFNFLVDFYEVKRFIAPHEKITVLDNRTQQWTPKYIGKKSIVVRSGLDLEKFPCVKRGPLHKNIKIFMAGIFFIHRRYEDAIRAVHILHGKGYDITLAIAGEHGANHEYAGYYKDLFALVSTCGLEKNIEFVGRLSDEELVCKYQESDMYISPNHLQSWGLAVFEAMASGCPVIVSTTAGASEVLTDGENALLIPPKNPEAIANAIERLLKDHALYESLSKKGRIFVEQNISWERYAKGMLKVFEEAVGEAQKAL